MITDWSLPCGALCPRTYQVRLEGGQRNVTPLCVLPRGHAGAHCTSATQGALQWDENGLLPGMEP